MELNMNFEVKDIGGYYEDRDAIFDDLWFLIPTPFKQGDIVWFSKGVDREPYVVTFEEKTISKLTRVDNLSAYRQVPDSCGEIELRFIHWYLDLEFYHGELDGNKKIIKVLSNYLKGKIDVGLFANSYHHYMTESYFQSTKPYHWSDEDLKLAGLKEK